MGWAPGTGEKRPFPVAQKVPSQHGSVYRTRLPQLAVSLRNPEADCPASSLHLVLSVGASRPGRFTWFQACVPQGSPLDVGAGQGRYVLQVVPKHSGQRATGDARTASKVPCLPPVHEVV